jgi:hypothetical protein
VGRARAYEPGEHERAVGAPFGEATEHWMSARDARSTRDARKSDAEDGERTAGFAEVTLVHVGGCAGVADGCSVETDGSVHKARM